MTATTLSEDYNYGDTSITVVSVSDIPSAPNSVKITNSYGDYVILKYTDISGTTLSGITIIGGNGSRTFKATSSAVRGYREYTSLGDISEAIEDLIENGGGQGTMDYNDLTNKPKLNSITLTGNLTTDDLGIASNQHADTHGDNGDDRIEIDASQVTTGIFDIDRIPAGAKEKLVTVPDDDARFELTTDDVQKGDTVFVTETKKMYMVVDDTQLDVEDGYQVYHAFVTWNMIEEKPRASRTNNGVLYATDFADFDDKPHLLSGPAEPTASIGEDGDIYVQTGVLYEEPVTDVKVNGVSVVSDGVATIPNELPAWTSADAGKVLAVKSDGSGLEWITIS